MEIIIGGDFYPGRRWENKILDNPKSIWSDEVMGFLKNADFRILNLETPLTYSDTPIHKIGPNLRCSPKIIDSLKFADINMVTLANNHVFDYGKEGLNDTTNHLKKNEIDFIGVGEHKYAARKSVKILDDIVFLNFCQNEWGVADENSPGYNKFDLIDIVNDINYYKNQEYFVVLILHYGHEGYELPSPSMVKKFRFLGDQGADLIINHHSHFSSGYEIYNDTHIFYSLGNMLFDSNNKDDRWFKTFLLKVNIENKIFKSFKIFPICNYIKDGFIRTLDSKDEAIFISNLDKLNEVICNETKLNESWSKEIERVRTSYFVNLKMKNKYFLPLANRSNFIKKIIDNDNNLMMLKNYINCDSHLEVIQSLLKL